MKKAILFLTCAILFSGCGDSGSQKWRLDNPSLTAEEVGILKEAIEKHENIKRNNSWTSLNGKEWSSILTFFPSERKKCLNAKGFEKFDGSNWAQLLAEEPRFKEDCEKNRGWEMIPTNEWVELLKKQPNYISKAKYLNVLKKFSAENWRNIILSKNPVLLQECDTLNGWEALKSNDWLALISSDEKYIDYAKKKNAFPKFDNAAWVKSILENPTFSQIAEKEGIFEKFSPKEWNILFISNPEFAAVAKRAKALEKYSKIDLIRLYALQPKLRNEIFALNKIDLDFAKQIEILHNRFANRGLLNAEEIIVLSSIFPEIFDSLSEQSFSYYDIKDWKIALAKSPLFFKKISEKFAYLVRWKEFSFSDWCEILDTNPSLIGAFKNNVKIPDLSVADITKAMTSAEFKGYYSLDTFDIWSQFTPEQYVGILSGQGGVAAMMGLIENISGVSINSAEDIQIAKYKIEQKQKSAAEKMVFGGDWAKEYLELFPQPKREPKNYDKKFIISKAKENGIFAKLTEAQWEILLGDINKRKDEALLLLIKEYLSLGKQYPTITQKLVDCANYDVISKFNLWDKLNPNGWIAVIFNIIRNSKSSSALKEVLHILDSLNAIENFEEPDCFKLIALCATVINSNEQTTSVKDFKDLSLWNKIPKKAWGLYFCIAEPNLFYIEKSDVKNWDKAETINLIKTYIDTKGEKRSNKDPLHYYSSKQFIKYLCFLKNKKYQSLDIAIGSPKSFAKIVNINSLDLAEARNAISKNQFLFDYYDKISEFSLDDLFYFYNHSYSAYEKAKSVNTLLKSLPKEDQELLYKIFRHLKRRPTVSIIGGFNHLEIAKSQIRITCTKCKKKYDDLRWRTPDSQNCTHAWSFSIGTPPKHPALNPFRKQSNKKIDYTQQ